MEKNPWTQVSRFSTAERDGTALVLGQLVSFALSMRGIYFSAKSA